MNSRAYCGHPSFNLIRALGLALLITSVLLPASLSTRYGAARTEAQASGQVHGQAQTHAAYLPMAVGNRAFDLQPVGQGFYVPLGITHAGDERIFIAERGGRIQILHPDGRETTFISLESRVVSSPGEYGLYDVAFHPGYADPDSPGYGFFYVFYTGKEGANIYSIISRLRVSADPDIADPASETQLFHLQQFNIYHKGGELDFDPRDNTLYAAIGDDTSPPNAQLPDTPKGKIIRLPVDDVPAAAVGDASDLIEPEIVAMGLRNPYRFDLDPQSNRLFIGDVGENTWEEVNVMTLDGTLPNMGWPCREGPEPHTLYQNHPVCAGNKPFVEPVAYLSHADGHCAVIAGKFTHTANRDGEFIFADACSHQIFSMTYSGGAWYSTQLGVSPAGGLLTTIGEDVHGNLYVGLARSNGPIYRLILR